MAEFTEEKTPYEFLVRWDENGTIRGSHVGWLDTVKKDGVILTQKPSNVESVSIANSNGFPLIDLLDQVQIDSFKQIDLLNQVVAQKDAEISQLNEQNSKLETDLESRNQTIASLQQQLFELNNK